MKLKLIYLTLFGFLFLIFRNYSLVLDTCIAAVNIWLYKVFPFLFVMFIANDILIKLNFNSFFKNSYWYVFMMSMFSGAPSNALIISSLYKNGVLSKENSHRCLLFCYFANPLFIYAFFNLLFGFNATIKLMAVHYLSNFIILLLNRKKMVADDNKGFGRGTFKLGDAINKSMSALIMILGTITFYMIITALLDKTFDIDGVWGVVLRGSLEVTQGLNSLESLKISQKIKETLAISFISFGGASIHSQVKSILDEENLEYKYFLRGRIWQTIISVIIIILL